MLQKLSWYDKPRTNWISLVKQFQLPEKVDKSTQVTKLLASSHKADGQATSNAAKVLLDAMQK